MPEEAIKPNEVPAQKKSRSTASVPVATLQRFDDWSLVSRVSDGEVKVIGQDLYPDGTDVLPVKFEMSSADWVKTIKPVSVAERMGFTGALGDSIDVSVWRKGRVRDDQPFTPAVIDSVHARLRRVLDKNFASMQPVIKE